MIRGDCCYNKESRSLGRQQSDDDKVVNEVRVGVRFGSMSEMVLVRILTWLSRVEGSYKTNPR